MIGISVETLRYWRNNIDPREEKDQFSGKDVLVYSVMNLMIRAEYVPVTKLKKHDWETIFNFCQQTSNKVLMNYAVIYDGENDLLFIDKFENIDFDDNYLHCVKFRNALSDINKNCYQTPRDNLIRINSYISKEH